MQHLKGVFGNVIKWLAPGMEVKRWLLLGSIGLLVFSFGLFLLIDVRSAVTAELAIRDFLAEKMGIRLSSFWIDVIICSIGIYMVLFSQRRFLQSIYTVIVPNESKKLVEVIYEKRKLDMGLKIVAIGGGTGLSTLLKGLKEHTNNLTAVVTVSDDGGSSGRLRNDFGMLPPGDIRNCLVALAKDESTLSSLFQYRFESGSGLEGHSFGNLFLAALNNIAGDDFKKAVKLSGDILSIRGKVYPATLEKTVLCAEMESGEIIEGESSIPKHNGTIRRVFLKPEKCSPLPEVIHAIREANIIVLGPGSLYTSILPNLKATGITKEIKESHALKIYVCNIMTQSGETSSFKASDHLQALYDNSDDGLVDAVIVNTETPDDKEGKYKEEGAVFVTPDTEKLEKMGVEVIEAPLVGEIGEKIRHNPVLLADAIIKAAAKRNPG